MGSSAGEKGAGSEALPASSGRVNAASLVTLVAPHRDPGLGGWSPSGCGGQRGSHSPASGGTEPS